jgi:anti-anti-sigma factor
MSSDRLKITVKTIQSRSGAVGHLALAGVLDGKTVDDFNLTLAAAAKEASLIVIDLEKLTGISSAGAGALLVAGDDRKGKLVLARPQRAVRTVLEALGVPAIVPLGESLEDALTKLRTR